eukprot:TRINITY_DN3114_c0_g4_i1.p1 TRINITY_DN3114_c0_g4~~TRINITY_DN3114_c0_g4_i1.p1  ORF type:complete len:255 (-),score=-22.38 TRINITY_DN3114_c0_g4_i1:244-1008(-)
MDTIKFVSHPYRIRIWVGYACLRIPAVSVSLKKKKFVAYVGNMIGIRRGIRPGYGKWLLCVCVCVFFFFFFFGNSIKTTLLRFKKKVVWPGTGTIFFFNISSSSSSSSFYFFFLSFFLLLSSSSSCFFFPCWLTVGDRYLMGREEIFKEKILLPHPFSLLPHHLNKAKNYFYYCSTLFCYYNPFCCYNVIATPFLLLQCYCNTFFCCCNVTVHPFLLLSHLFSKPSTIFCFVFATPFFLTNFYSCFVVIIPIYT